MFTNEFDHDEIMITVMDDGGFYEDVKIGIYDDVVTIRQWDDHLQIYQELLLSPEMFRDMLLAINEPEGLFIFQPKET